MTQVKLWQIASKTPNALVMSDSDGNLVSLSGGNAAQVLVLSPNGIPSWVENEALAVALDVKSQSGSILADAKAYTHDQIAKLVDDAPLALDTLKELADKLGGQDNALNALLLQIEQKANAADVYSKTEADALLAAALTAGNTRVDQKISDTQEKIVKEIQTAKGAAVAVAGEEATLKVNAAIAIAGATAQQLAETAQVNAIAVAATDAQQKADTATSNAVDLIHQQLLTSYGVTSTILACLYGSVASYSLDNVIANGLSLKGLQEITGADLDDSSTLAVKAVFVNGVAIGPDSKQVTATATMQTAIIRFQPELAKRVFDGEDNSIMVLIAIERISAIMVNPAKL